MLNNISATHQEQQLITPYTLTGPLAEGLGWTFHPSTPGESVYIPFEGVYASKGGRVQSPKITLDRKSGQGAFYQLTFTATAKVQGYWWMDFFDQNGTPLPDINSSLYASSEPRNYTEVFFVDPRATEAAIAFVSQEGISIGDVSLKQISPLQAAAWCDELYAQLPQPPLPCDPHAFDRLPRTAEALTSGKPWTILLLGDSLVNDTWTSNFQALVMRDFPQANLHFLISVRGSTGCWYYKEPAHFKEYVTDLHPDLVMIGGISNNLNKSGHEDPKGNMVSVIRQCQALGCEVLVMSPPPSWEWRTSTEPAEWDGNWSTGSGLQPAQRDYQRLATQETQIAYWDLSTLPFTVINEAKMPMDWFRRDAVHNNDRGKQLIGQTLAAWFRMAAKLPSHSKE